LFGIPNIKGNSARIIKHLHKTSPQMPIDIIINNETVKSKSTMNVLGIQFDSQHKWDSQVAMAISKAERALHGIRLIKRHFRKDELKQLLTSNYYSILYYNSEVRHLPSLQVTLKNSCYQHLQWDLRC
jgi:beta-glucosidase/6-phospho-beta-glucosidase/beta-galactosidase